MLQLYFLCGRYFEDDDDEQKTLSELEYQPAPGSPTLERMNASTNQKDDDSSSDSSDDPLDSFMADIEASFVTCCFICRLVMCTVVESKSEVLIACGNVREGH